MTRLNLMRLHKKTVYVYLRSGDPPTPYIVAKEKGRGWGLRQPVGIKPDWIPLANAWQYMIIGEQEYRAGKPLNVQQLQEMRAATWVWIECFATFDNPFQKSDYFKKTIGSLGNIRSFSCGYPGVRLEFPFDSYGKDWLAYTHRPSIVELESQRSRLQQQRT